METEMALSCVRNQGKIGCGPGTLSSFHRQGGSVSLSCRLGHWGPEKGSRFDLHVLVRGRVRT